MTQNLTFSERVNQLFFEVSLEKYSPSLIDSLRTVSKLQYNDNYARQWNLNVSMEMKSSDAWSSRHTFTFTESPLPDLKIEKGEIVVILGETDSSKKLIDLNWQIEFTDKASAKQYFETLKQIFSEVSTNQKFEREKGYGEIAQFSSRNAADTGVRDITIYFGKLKEEKNYQISLHLWSDFINQ